MSVYALSEINSRSPAHFPAPDGKRTLCGLPLVMFGEPLESQFAERHPRCLNCLRVEATVESWKRKAV